MLLLRSSLGSLDEYVLVVIIVGGPVFVALTNHERQPHLSLIIGPRLLYGEGGLVHLHHRKNKRQKAGMGGGWGETSESTGRRSNPLEQCMISDRRSMTASNNPVQVRTGSGKFARGRQKRRGLTNPDQPRPRLRKLSSNLDEHPTGPLSFTDGSYRLQCPITVLPSASPALSCDILV